METATLLPLMLTGASTGLSCGLSCGACGNPMVNVFLAGYLFTHTDRMKKSLTAFAGYHAGRALTVSLLCALLAWFGSQFLDAQGNFFGIELQAAAYVLMLIFTVVLLFRWLAEARGKKSKCAGTCHTQTSVNTRFGALFLYGMASGLSPCASLLVVFSYASALTAGEAALVGLAFSLANSVIPLVLLTALTGLLSEQMHREIPTKIRYFQLATYVLFACVLIKNLFAMI